MLTSAQAKKIVQEHQKRLAKRTPKPAVILDLTKYCFNEQVLLINDAARYRAVCLPRRSGKTTMCAYDLVNSALQRDGVVCLYITLARSNAKKLIWPMLQQICRDLDLKVKINETDLAITFPNQSIIYCSGAKDRTEIEKFRGLALVNCYIDEAQSFKDYVRELIDDVIAPALRDYNGKCTLTGTPGPVPKGFFYECTQNLAWSNHFWNGKANVWLERKSGQTFEVQLAAEMARMGVGINHPTIQREWFGRWVIDTDHAVFKYKAGLNDFKVLPEGKWNYVIAADIGYEDSDAIAVLGWVDHSNSVYVIEEFVKSKQGITELANILNLLYNKYQPIKMVADFGGLGKKIAEEIKFRYQLPLVAAEKTRKFEYIEILNDALRRGELFARSNGHFAQDSLLVEWETPMVKLKDTYHSDITDAVLYGFRECCHYLEDIVVAKLPLTQEEMIAKRLEKMEQQIDLETEQHQEQSNVLDF